jgi:phosphate starvation-inducible PhoH-like protein
MAKRNVKSTAGLQLKPIHPKTPAQNLLFDAYNKGNSLFLHGSAGSGKTFIALALSLQDVLNNIVPKLYILRSAVPSRQIGHLPGTPDEKIAVYEDPYQSLCTKLFGTPEAYRMLAEKNLLEFVSTSFLRGVTFENCIVLVDEAQNMTQYELDTVLTRPGKNCRLIVCCDTPQTDLHSKTDASGLGWLRPIIDSMESITKIEFHIEDVVRSGWVKEYLLAKQAIYG